MSREQYRIKYYVKIGHGKLHGLEALCPLDNISTTQKSKHKKIIARQNKVVLSGYTSSEAPSAFSRRPVEPSTQEYSRSFQENMSCFTLPGEVRRIVTDELFTSCRHDLGLRSTLTTCHEGYSYIHVCLPKDFIQLLTSKQFFQEGVGSFTRFTNIDLNNCKPTSILNGVHKIHSLKFVLRQVLAQSTQISIESACKGRRHSREVSMVQSLSLYVDKIETINIHTDDVYYWRRLLGGVSYAVKNNDTTLSAHSSHSMTPRLVTPIMDCRRCEIQKIYPYAMKEDLQPQLFKHHAYGYSKKLLDRLRMTGKEVSVYYWLVIKCDIDCTSLASGQHHTSGFEAVEEAIILVIDVATRNLAHLKVRPAGSLRSFSGKRKSRFEMDNSDINELLK